MIWYVVSDDEGNEFYVSAPGTITYNAKSAKAAEISDERRGSNMKTHLWRENQLQCTDASE